MFPDLLTGLKPTAWFSLQTQFLATICIFDVIDLYPYMHSNYSLLVLNINVGFCGSELILGGVNADVYADVYADERDWFACILKLNVFPSLLEICIFLLLYLTNKRALKC